MRIDNVQIEAYGEKEGLSLDYTRGHFQLTYGANEAGKSTTLSFIRNVLFGLDAKSNSDVDLPYALRRPEAGGALSFTLAEGGDGRVFRRWNCGQRKEVFFDCRVGTTFLNRDEFVTRVLGCDRDFFKNHFGFSSLELYRGGEALAKSEIAKFLFGASIGDFDAVVNLKADLESRISELYAKTKRSKKTKIDFTIANITKITQQQASAANKSSGYRSKLDEYERLKREAEQTTARRNVAERERARLEKLASARAKYLQYRGAADELAKLLAETRFEDAARFSEKDEREYSELETQARELLVAVNEQKRAIDESVRNIDSMDLGTSTAICNESKGVNDVVERLGEYKGKVAEIPKTIEELEDLSQELLRDLDVFYLRSEAETVDEAFARAQLEAPNPLLIEEIERCAAREKEIDDELRKVETKRQTYESELEKARATLATRCQELADEFGVDEQDWSDARDAVEEAKNQIPTIRAAVRELTDLVQESEENGAKESEIARELAIQANAGAAPTPQFVGFLQRFVAPAEFESFKAKRDELAKRRVEFEQRLAAIDSELASLNVEDSDVEEGYKLIERRLKNLIDDLYGQWYAIEHHVIAEPTLSQSRREEIVEKFRTNLAALDTTAEEFGAFSKKLGEYECRYARFELQILARKRALEDLATIDAELAAIDASAREMWMNFGFEKCADWDLETTARWLEQHKSWREAALETAKKRRRAIERARENADALLKILVRFQPWSNLDAASAPGVALFTDDSDAPNCASDGSPRELLAALSELLQYVVGVSREVEAATKRYDLLARNRDAALNDVRKDELNVAQYENELARLRETLASHAARLTSFCEESRLRFNASAETSWQTLLYAAKLWDDWRDGAIEYKRKAARLENDEKFVADYGARVTSLVERVLHRESNGIELDAQALKDAWNEATANKRRYEDEIKRRDGARARLSQLNDNLTDLRRDAQLRRAAFGIESEEDFVAFRQEARTYRTLESQFNDARNVLEAALDVPTDSDEGRRFFDEWESNDESTLQARFAHEEANVDELEKRFVELNRRVGELSKELKGLETSEGNVALREELRGEVAALRGYVDEYAPLKLALMALDRSLDRFRDERIPQILSIAQDLFSRVTDGRYVEISTKETKNKEAEYVVYDEHRACKNVSELSSGTREQLYLALKLALIREYAANSEPLPILIDDALVNSDDNRARHIMNVLAEFASERQQIVLFSHSLATRNAFCDVVGEDAVVDLRGTR